jgi:predicted enzyme related to lactoylglutathione lyase
MLQAAPIYAYLPAHDLARARKFYEGKLGWKPARVNTDGVTYEFANGTGCFLYMTPNAGTNKASQLFWIVGDLDREMAELRERGVGFQRYAGMTSDVASDGNARSAWFEDPEGNILAIVQPR